MSMTTSEAGRLGAAADLARFYAQVDEKFPDLEPNLRDQFARELYTRSLAARGHVGGSRPKTRRQPTTA